MKVSCSVEVFLGLFCIVAKYVAILYSGYNAHFIRQVSTTWSTASPL